MSASEESPSSVQCSFRKNEHVFPAWDDVRIPRAFPGTPRRAPAHRLFVPDDFRAHDESERTLLRRHVVVDRLKVLDACRRDVQSEAPAIHEDTVKFLPHRLQPRQILIVRHAVVVIVVFEPDVVGRRRDGEMRALVPARLVTPCGNRRKGCGLSRTYSSRFPYSALAWSPEAESVTILV